MNFEVIVKVTDHNAVYSEYKSIPGRGWKRNDDLAYCRLVLSQTDFQTFMEKHIDNIKIDWEYSQNLFENVLLKCSDKMIDLFIQLYNKYKQKVMMIDFLFNIENVLASRSDIPVDIWKKIFEIYPYTEILRYIVRNSVDDQHLAILDIAFNCYVRRLGEKPGNNEADTKWALSEWLSQGLVECIKGHNVMMAMYCFYKMQLYFNESPEQTHPSTYLLLSIVSNCTKLTDCILDKYYDKKYKPYNIEFIWYDPEVFYAGVDVNLKVKLDSIMYFYELYVLDKISIDFGGIMKLMKVVYNVNNFDEALSYLITVFPIEAVSCKELNPYTDDIRRVHRKLLADLK